MNGRQRLNIVIDKLFPGKCIKIGDSDILIRPLSFSQIALVFKKFDLYTEELSKTGITFENFQKEENILKLALVLIEKFPDVLAEISNIEQEDIVQLPIEEIVKIIDAAFEVNLAGKDSIRESFKNIEGKLKEMMPPKKE